jgi:hypothetical protein
MLGGGAREAIETGLGRAGSADRGSRVRRGWPVMDKTRGQRRDEGLQAARRANVNDRRER